MPKLTRDVEIIIPSTPNFIKVNDKMTPIQDFTNEELKEIGRWWTEMLVSRAIGKRSDYVIKNEKLLSKLK